MHVCGNEITRTLYVVVVYISFLFIVVRNCWTSWRPQLPSVKPSCTAPLKIYIVNATLGRSVCAEPTGQECCPNNTDCIVTSTQDHITYMKGKCDGQHTCTIYLINQWCSDPTNGGPTDYESVHYVCGHTDPGETLSSV